MPLVVEVGATEESNGAIVGLDLGGADSAVLKTLTRPSATEGISVPEPSPAIKMILAVGRASGAATTVEEDEAAAAAGGEVGTTAGTATAGEVVVVVVVGETVGSGGDGVTSGASRKREN
jgi:hypothetical protein